MERRNAPWVDGVSKASAWLVAAIFAAMYLCVMLQIVARYAIDFPVAWTEELARFLLTAITFVGATILWIRHGHIATDFLISGMPDKGIASVKALMNLLAFVLFLAMVFGSWTMSVWTWERSASSMSWFRIGYLYAMVTACAAVMMIFAARDVLACIGQMRGDRR
ncbi:TRAP transporter small permease subunit [Chelativorans sp. AA-79]|uniref:TRAP transporter small permease n=1 Tax=Chelativorans sp. AA-79 TaxID=3028735 RepID=UPI0023F8EDCB|nr:TRAP transporter small permease subunit [Chelativorans sp. AA-79]WEX12068.1 TRAP transporter small permease subunit [Chelativorans sp. AA-79]